MVIGAIPATPAIAYQLQLYLLRVAAYVRVLDMLLKVHSIESQGAIANAFANPFVNARQVNSRAAQEHFDNPASSQKWKPVAIRHDAQDAHVACAC